MGFFRLSEWLKGYVKIEVWNDAEQTLLKTIVASRISLWDVRQSEQFYTLYVLLPDLPHVLQEARSMRVKVRFASKTGLPFLWWHARRRKVFLVGAAFFVASLYMLSSFIWHVEIIGTDQPEEVGSALKQLNIYPGSLFYRVMAQDDVQLALLELLPEVSWVGVKIQGTSVFVRVIPRIAPAKRIAVNPQNIVATVPGVVENVLASNGQVLVKQGEYVTPGTVLISGVLDNLKQVHADGKVKAIVWYRTELKLPLKRMNDQYTGSFVRHDYLVIGKFPVMVWGFSHPPYPSQHTQSITDVLQVGSYKLPIAWRVDTVFEVRQVTKTLTNAQAITSGQHFAIGEVLQMTPEGSKVIRQNILQHKLARGNLYMTVWSEVLQDIGKPQAMLDGTQ